MSDLDTSVLHEALGRLAPIASLPLERREEIAHMSVVEKFTPEQGEIDCTEWVGKVVYLIAGEAKFTFPDGSFDVMVGGADSARNPLQSVDQLLRTCKPITDIELLRLDEQTLDLMLAWDQLSVKPGAPGPSEKTDWRMMSGMFAIQNLASGAFAPLPAANISRTLTIFRERAA